ncbi:MAG TPA: DUF885 domain-containing protein [Candidatus Ozemobacteraceae bacterium]|nr:DUF885 domain-containing protein [Candidatus Ozemobacteraceae bacterium]
MRRRAVYRHAGFKAIAGHFYAELLRRNPITATTLGEHAYDGLLPEVGAEAVDREIAGLREMRDAFQSLPERELSIDERLDRELALHMARMQLFLLEDVRRWRLGCDLAMMIGDALFMLFVRDFAPLHERVESMLARLRAVPAYLMSGRTLFQHVPPLWGEIFIESAERLPDLLSAIEGGLSGRLPPPVMQSFAHAAQEARRAVAEHAHWLKFAIMPQATGDWAMEKGPFQALLGARQLGLTSGELLELGETSLRQAQNKVDLHARALSGSQHGTTAGLRKAAIERIQAHAPATFEQALAAYRDAVARSRAWVEMTGFAAIPEGEQLEVIETPSYLAHLIPFAAYMPPERTARPQKGIYLVTRHAGDQSMHNYADIANTSIHEGYPGHHLQLSGQNLHPGLWRGLADSIELMEGWAHYCEEAVLAGGIEANHENRLVQGRDEAWRSARILIDINLHQKSWSYDEGLAFLMEHTAMNRASAEAEMRRYTQTPGYPLSYMAGKHLLLELKNSLQQRYGADCPDRAFHDLVINEGSLPLFLAREYYPKLLEEQLAAGQREQRS